VKIRPVIPILMKGGGDDTNGEASRMQTQMSTVERFPALDVKVQLEEKMLALSVATWCGLL
jgi:hypothetical protein